MRCVSSILIPNHILTNVKNKVSYVDKNTRDKKIIETAKMWKTVIFHRINVCVRVYARIHVRIYMNLSLFIFT